MCVCQLPVALFLLAAVLVFSIRGKVVAVIYPFSRWQTVKAINPQQG